jgi:hypothetical protein
MTTGTSSSHAMTLEHKENQVPAASQTIQTTTLSIKPASSHTRGASNSSTTSSLSPYAVASSSAASSSSSLRRPLSRHDSAGNSSDDSSNRSADYVLAMHDYDADPSSGTCLSFKAGQVIRVFNRDNSGWWDGELDGQRGWFPSNYVSEDVSSVSQEISPSKLVSASYVPPVKNADRCAYDRANEDDMLDWLPPRLSYLQSRGVVRRIARSTGSRRRTRTTTTRKSFVHQAWSHCYTASHYSRVRSEQVASLISSRQPHASSPASGPSSLRRSASKRPRRCWCSSRSCRKPAGLCFPIWPTSSTRPG